MEKEIAIRIARSFINLRKSILAGIKKVVDELENRGFRQVSNDPFFNSFTFPWKSLL